MCMWRGESEWEEGAKVLSNLQLNNEFTAVVVCVCVCMCTCVCMWSENQNKGRLFRTENVREQHLVQ